MGQMGNERVTTQNLQVVGVDEEDGLILVKGAVPGAKSGWVLITDAVKRARPDDAPLPAGLKEEAPKAAAEEKPADDAPAAEAEAPKEEAKVDAPQEEAKTEEKKDDKS